MTRFVLNGYELDSKKSEAKAKIIDALGSNVFISENIIEVKYSSDATKVVEILDEVEVQYSGD
ncbi:MAG: hypothetical protein HC836_29555 [Richelia sp. RM2_1_2]|nr:hypothetical protein [Richelia sp. RM2_1_2]